MAKRKRDEDACEVDRGASIKQQRVEHKLKQASFQTKKAFGTAQRFERQKLSRRRKNAVAENNQKDVARIDNEINALKTLDTGAFARHLLFRTLQKIKELSNHPHLPESAKTPGDIAKDAATLNVNARLCKSNQVQAALDTGLADIQNALGIDAAKTSVKQRRTRAKDRVSTGRADAVSGVKDLNDEEAEGLASDEEYGALGDRIAPYADESQDERSDQDDVKGRTKVVKPRRTEPNAHAYNHEADLSISGSESGSQSASPEPQKAPVAKKSSFLPSLTLGGYVSGSGSDAEDDIDVAPRKNRRGQRARQQIWEKKFGSQAKHLHGQDRDAGWDPKRGAVDGSGRGRNQRVTRRGPDYKTGARSERSKPLPGGEAKKTHKDDGGAIHPSWEAAKKAKEKSDAPATFQGKRTTFD